MGKKRNKGVGNRNVVIETWHNIHVGYWHTWPILASTFMFYGNVNIQKFIILKIHIMYMYRDTHVLDIVSFNDSI